MARWNYRKVFLVCIVVFSCNQLLLSFLTFQQSGLDSAFPSFIIWSRVNWQRYDNEKGHPLFPSLAHTKADIHVNGHRIDIGVSNIDVEKPITVSVVLHSHVDPGWLETFEYYYKQKVRRILDLAVTNMIDEPALRFIWSETSFLARWWRDANNTQKIQMKQLVSEGRLELCGGAWVMTDEATPHHFASIDNIIEGQRFLYETFGVRPNTSWSVDPFGHGLMMPYLLPSAGIDHLVIGRINDGQKEQMRQKRTMRFHWRQPYHSARKEAPEGPLVNVLPFLYYTTVNGCGPNQTVCCKYHVGESVHRCDGTINLLTEENVTEHAIALLDQYRQTQKLYNTEHILIAVGDDFYMTQDDDWKTVSNVYLEIANFFDTHPEHNAKMRFSTVSEFFKDLDEEHVPHPSLTGDFFPYVAKEESPNKYWTGFFTHRPFFKRFGRIVEGKLRALDLLRVLSGKSEDSEALTVARRDLALFQHHDAITGTSRRRVMEDYLKRLQKAFQVISDLHRATLASIIQRPFKTIRPIDKFKNAKVTYLPFDVTIRISNEGTRIPLLVFNQLANVAEHKLRVVVDFPNVRVLDATGISLKAQLNPVFRRGKDPIDGIYELIFIARIPPMSVAKFVIEGTSDGSATIASIFSSFAKDMNIDPLFVKNLPLTQFEGSIGNDKYTLQVNAGRIEAATKTGKDLRWGFQGVVDCGGAYVFEKCQATNKTNSTVASKTDDTVVLQGPIEDVIITYESEVQQILTITHSPRGADSLLESYLDIRLFTALEMKTAMFLHVDTQINNEGRFSTDANGLFLLQRQYNTTKPLDGNVFPASSSTYIEDGASRLTVHVGQPSGVVSNATGRLSIMIDRVVDADDQKGLSKGDAFDDHSPDIRLRLMLEDRSGGVELSSSHSVPAQHVQDSLRYPVVAFTAPESSGVSLPVDFSNWPCQFDIINMRFVSPKTLLIILRRLVFDASLVQRYDCTTDEVEAWKILKSLSNNGSMFHSDLSGTAMKGQVTKDSFVRSLKEPFALSLICVDWK